MTAIDSPPKKTFVPLNLKKWSIEDYHRLSEFGLLGLHERTELISGQITIMAAKGVPHVNAVRLLALQLDSFLRDRDFFAIAQDPIQLGDLSEPEPDLVIVRGDVFTYVDRHPRQKDIVLIVEVADSTLKYDCEVKEKLYAQENLEEYWVVDLKNRQVHIFQQPTPEGYNSHLILKENNSISPLAFPELTVEIASILPPIA